MTEAPFQPDASPRFSEQDTAIAAIAEDWAPPPPRPWGPWATIGWTLLSWLVGLVVVVIIGFVLGIVIGIVGVAVDGSGENVDDVFASYVGFIELLSYIPMAGAVLGFLFLPIWMRKFRYSDYVGYNPCQPRQYAIAFFAIIGFIVLEEGLVLLLNRAAPQWMIDTWESSGSLLLLMFVVVIVAPIAEEVVFRGFMFRGLSGTRFGPVLPILVTSLIWAAIHVQYALFEIVLIFFVGLLLGWVRHWTGSIKPAILMHLTMNLISTVMFALMYA